MRFEDRGTDERPGEQRGHSTGPSRRIHRRSGPGQPPTGADVRGRADERWDVLGGDAGESPPPDGPDLWDMMEDEAHPPAAPSVWEMLEEETPVAGRAPANIWELAEAPQEENGGADLPPPPKRPRKQRTPKPQKPKRPHRWRRRIVTTLVWGLLLAVLWVVGSVLHDTRNDALWLDLDALPYRTETILYYTDRQTGELHEYARLPCTQNKVYTDPALMPQALKDAFVAVEDKDFYSHGGVSFSRTVYAMLNEAVHGLTGSYIGGGIKQGASTINQQLVKNLTRDDEVSGSSGYMRKLREIVRAWRMDRDYDKDTILCAYLNSISFTGNTAGVGAEAYKLFGKPVEELSLAECASLAAITRNPARYNPVTHPEEHLQRRNYVLGLMLEQGYIGEAEYLDATAAALVLDYRGEPAYSHTVTDYFTDTVMEMVIQELVQQKGLSRAAASDLLYNGGLRIVTTVDPALQTAMEQTLQDPSIYPQIGATVRRALVDEDGAPVLDAAGNPVYGEVTVTPQAAMISLDYEGGICAVVGGYGEKTISRGFNRATSAVRQVGSTMKPIGPYAVALERDAINWSTPFLDSPVRQVKDPVTGEETDWPANANRSYSGNNILVNEALARSVNTVAVRVGEEAGVGRMYRFVRNTLGVSTLTRQDRDLGPLVLGSSTYGITPMEMAMAYAMFGNGGVVNRPYAFTRIENGAGRLLLEPRYESRQAISPETATVMNRLLGGVMESGGTAAGMGVRNGMASVGKTGTTSDRRDHWFVGLTPYYVTASWYGYDENLPLGVDSHWNPPILAWRNVMERGQAGLADKSFPYDSGVVERQYCTQSGSLAGTNCPARKGWYKAGKLPASRCPLHG